MPRHRSLFLPVALWPLLAFTAAHADTATPSPWQDIRPVLEQKCYDCHGGKKTKGGVDLKKLHDDPQLATQFEMWEKVKEVIASGDMPPDDKPPLPGAEKTRTLGWLTHSLDETIRANAGDPGTVTIRRLTNTEYDHTLRDLTGVDLGLARDFTPDGGGGEGFSNVGDVLFTSPQQLDKYFAAARKLADHATIMPGTGITFQPQRVGLRGFVQVKAQAEQALYVWYQKMAEPILPKDGEDAREADYMTACWKWKHKDITGVQSLEQLAKDSGLMLPFLENWWNVLTNLKPESRYLDLTRVGWRELPPPDAAKPKEVPAAVTAKILQIQADQRSWLGPAKNPGGGVQRQQQDSDGIRKYPFKTGVGGHPVVHLVLGNVADGNKGDWVTFDEFTLKHGKKKELYLDWLKSQLAADKDALAKLSAAPAPAPAAPTKPVAAPAAAPATPAAQAPTAAAKPAAPSSPSTPTATAANAPKPATASATAAAKPTAAPVDPAKLKARIATCEATLAKFGKDPRGGEAKPDAIVVQAPLVIDLPLPEDALEFSGAGKLDIDGPDADAASVQWLATVDAPPDPTKVIPGRLTIWKRGTTASGSLMREFNAMKVAFPDEYVRRLEEVSRNFIRGGNSSSVYYLSDKQLLTVIPAAEKAHWEKMMIDWKLCSRGQLNAQQGKEWDDIEKKQLADFATRAWRHPLSADESTQIAALYDAARARELDRESAGREVIVRVLVSPQFLFKLEDATQPGVQPLTAWEVATRLSYFIWASAPDDALRAAATDGSLLKPDVLARETKRLLRDPRSSALAEEFAGQWLKFNGFETKANIDGKKFPEFTPELKRDMYREAVEFFTHLIREDRPVREIVSADYTFLNERLAKFYGVPNVTGEDFRQVKVAEYQRGGVLGMGALLAKNSYPHRTSPVLRGNWLLVSVLGTPTPPPPNNVPKLDDSVSKASTLRERLERHRQDKACSVCHDRIDPLGFALEGFDPIGRTRTQDEAGLPIDNSGQWKTGATFKGIEGLRNFLGQHDAEFTNNFCRKLIGYALGRTVILTDKPLIETMRTDLAKSDDHLSAAILDITKSRQFLNRRNE